MLYAGVLIDNLVVFLLVGAGLVLWSYLWLPSAMLIATRAMFAWSFDRLVPEKLSEVHPRYNSPWVAVIVVAVIAEAFLILYHIGVFKFLTPALAYYFVFWLVSLCGVLFPFLAKTTPLFEASAVNWRLAGIPVMSICGVVRPVLLHGRAVLHADQRPAVPQQPAAAGHDRAAVRHPARSSSSWPLSIDAARASRSTRRSARSRRSDPASGCDGRPSHGRADDLLRRRHPRLRRLLPEVAECRRLLRGRRPGHRRRPDRQDPAADLSRRSGHGEGWTATWKEREQRLETRREVDELVRDRPRRRDLRVRDDARRGRRDPGLARRGAGGLHPAEAGRARGLDGARRRTPRRPAVQAFVMAGNDDPPEIDAVLATSPARSRTSRARRPNSRPGSGWRRAANRRRRRGIRHGSCPTMRSGDRVRDVVDGLPAAARRSGTCTCRRTTPASIARRDSTRACTSSTTGRASRDGAGRQRRHPRRSSPSDSRRSPCTATSTRVAGATGSGRPTGSIPAASTRTACCWAPPAGLRNGRACATWRSPPDDAGRRRGTPQVVVAPRARPARGRGPAARG